jgi:hypothetical protein
VYLRLFDVDEDRNLQKPIPVAPVTIPHIEANFEYVPVVFITQQALVALPDSSLDDLALRICALSEHICKQAGIAPSELQIDCDWTSSNKEKYFSLLRAIKQLPFLQGKVLSATIRLNQVKYQTLNGIPPVDRGMVMVYGMGSIKNPGAHNSILDAREAKDYLKFIDRYPLPVDIALPIFEWCVLFREQQFVGILRDVSVDEVAASHLFHPHHNVLFTCLQDTMWQGYHLRANDEVRAEAPAKQGIQAIAEYTASLAKNKDINVVLFSCDSLTLSKYSANDLEKIYSSYQ